MKQSIHHPNVDCVPDHLENEIVLIQCVKRWPYIYIYINFVNVLSWLAGNCQNAKSFSQYCEAVSGRDLTTESWGFVPSKPFQIASLDRLEFSHLSPTMSTWKRPPTVKYPRALVKDFTVLYLSKETLIRLSLASLVTYISVNIDFLKMKTSLSLNVSVLC